MKSIVLFLITVYQKTLSPDHGLFRFRFPYGYCRFHPTCSEYAKESFQRHGILYGFVLSLARIGRCNPWNKGGIDPVPGHRAILIEK